jgi:hypothetical protein
MENNIKRSTPNSRETGWGPGGKCPHCQRRLTPREIATILHGSGYEQYAEVKLPSGTVDLMEIGLINPLAVEVLD